MISGMRGAVIQRHKSCRNRTGHFIKLISVADNKSFSAFTWTPGLEPIDVNPGQDFPDQTGQTVNGITWV